VGLTTKQGEEGGLAGTYEKEREKRRGCVRKLGVMRQTRRGKTKIINNIAPEGPMMAVTLKGRMATQMLFNTCGGRQ
jgi:hypothetical protein